jgi:hypothetical protein
VSFWIQASSPRVTSAAEPEDTDDLWGALEAAFPLQTEYAFVVWNHVFVPLSYKSDLSIMATDIVEMLDALLAHDRGSHRIAWPSSSFRVDWTLEWNGQQLSVEATWESVLGRVERLLAETGGLQIERQQFLGEWRPLLGRLHEALIACGYDEEHVEGMRELDRIRRLLPGPGLLYRD